MKRFLNVVVVSVLAVTMSAQSVSVSDFRLLDTDLTAITLGTQEIDQNGEVAALIKVVTPEIGFTFDIGALGVVGTKQAVGEIWVYIPKRAQKISIYHQQYGVIRNYYFPIPIESGRTYELKLDVQKEISKDDPTILSDDEIAFRSYRAMAEEGDVSSQYFTGYCLFQGKGIQQDYYEAVEWFQKAADQGHARAEYYLGLCYENGWGVSKKLSEAFKYYKKSASQMNEIAYFSLADCYYNGKGVVENYEEAYKWCKKAAESDYSDAFLLLGEMLFLGKGVTRNYSDAFKWFSKAAELEEGNKAIIYFYLGECYRLGIGVNKNEEKAIKYYKESAKLNNPEANYIMVYYYNNSYEKELFEHLKQIEEKDNSLIQYLLACCYEFGWGTEKDDYWSNEWYYIAFPELITDAEAGDVIAQTKLALCYLRGKGTDKNPEEAIVWLNKAIKQKSTEAKIILGYCYKKGLGVERDSGKAQSWFQKARNSALDSEPLEVKELEFKI